MKYLILTFSILISAQVFAFGSKTASSVEIQPKQIEVEVLVYEGSQYLNFVLRTNYKGQVIGENQIDYLNNSSWQKMEMWHLGKLKNVAFYVKCNQMNGNSCSSFGFRALNTKTDASIFSCSFNLNKKDNLLWITEEYVCDKDLIVDIINDNEWFLNPGNLKFKASNTHSH